MEPRFVQVELEPGGNWRTFRTCNSHVGAWADATGKRPKNWEYIDFRTTIVEGCFVIDRP